MLIVALTGGICAGKSVVAKILAKNGCYVQNADKVAHDLMKPGRPAWHKIVERFGEEILNPDRSINRSRLGAIVFADKVERQFLNRLIHPLVLERKKRTIQRLEKKGHSRIFVSEAALTIESSFGPFFDKIIVVDCGEDIQIKRLMERNHISRTEARRKIRVQMPSSEKRKHADYIIDTSRSVEETAAQAENVFRRLLGDYQRKQERGKRAV